ncbi:2OG-Fe(II) oxygenase [Mycena alexandri]|uniref:2OG-Fe(II) oxygenase n=1 Tax=Mycena alexandri TaxID=1745969 RepID=A0AAD6SL71_9AGAR|nr:2OG-Fe(II) oxygenase [Mycena alexandri]
MTNAGGVEIPIIDLTSNTDAILQQIRRASETVGLFYIQKHGIPEEILSRCLAASADFFSFDDKTKLALWQEDPPASNVGYRPSLDSKLDPQGTPDLMEGLTLHWEDLNADEAGSQNKWPVKVPALRQATLHYYAHALELGTMLLQLIALAMGLEEDFLLNMTGNNSSRMRLLRYPSQSRDVIAAGSHSDFGLFTILLQQPGMEALQLAVPKTGWTVIPPIPGTLVVNLGDQSSIVTNGVFRSALHRVVSRRGPERHSVPLFFMADADVVLQPNPVFVTPERPSQYEMKSARERLDERMDASWAPSRRP